MKKPLYREFGVVYKETKEDWHPSFQLCTKNFHNDTTKLVRLHFFAYISKKPFLYRICVTGADDTRMELDTKDLQRAKNTWAVLLKATDVSRLLCTSIGFKFQ